MTKHQEHTDKTQAGEALIRHWFRRSLAIILGIGSIAAGTGWYLSRDTTPAVTIEEAIVSGPVIEEGAQPETPPTVIFRDITRAAGIDFVHTNGAYGDKLMPESIGSGAAFFDYDNDGDQDLLLVNSSWFPGHEQDTTPTLALYQNDGSGQFADVTREAGLAINCFGMGVATGDLDNDGWTDLYITTLGENYLLKNGQGHFTDITTTSGTAGQPADWSTAAAFLDIDNDGDLDLFVGNYIQWSREIDLEIDFRVTGLGRAIGAPNHFFGTTNRLYRNDGQGRFSDVSQAAGIVITDPVTQAQTGKALAVAPVDYDRDGRMDLFVANDTTQNFLYHNLGEGQFEEIGALEGIAFDRNGKATGAMGMDAAYFRNDGDLGIGIGNFANEMSSLYVTVGGQPPFADEAILEGFGPASRLALTFGLFFFDYDLDGRLDLFQANGHLETEINVVQSSQTYAQAAQLFWNCGSACRGRFVAVAGTGDLATPMVGRGAAYADIDNDGDLDIIVVQNGRRAMLFRNEQSLGHHWLRVRLTGNTANRNAIGAVVELSVGGVTQRRVVMPTRSYLSQSELPLTFGLGSANATNELHITWPDGQQQMVPVPRVDV
ncbi:MAG TPA: CRTAC1 family protein, partial [Gammaproteobacteria bacterium]|nr:CRTAC1 family protein [Gammaproteobacteria bacterium]